LSAYESLELLLLVHQALQQDRKQFDGVPEALVSQDAKVSELLISPVGVEDWLELFELALDLFHGPCDKHFHVLR